MNCLVCRPPIRGRDKCTPVWPRRNRFLANFWPNENALSWLLEASFALLAHQCLNATRIDQKLPIRLNCLARPELRSARSKRNGPAATSAVSCWPIGALQPLCCSAPSASTHSLSASCSRSSARCSQTPVHTTRTANHWALPTARHLLLSLSSWLLLEL